MIGDINFLSAKTNAKVRRQRGVIVIRIAAVLSLFAIGIVSLILYLLSNTVFPKSLKDEQESLVKNLNTLSTRQVKLAHINDRLNNVSEVLSRRTRTVTETGGGTVQDGTITERADYSKIISKFSEKIPKDVRIDNLRVEKQSVLLTLSSESLLPIESLLDGLLELGRDKTVRSLLMDSLSLNETSGTYSLSLKAEL